MEMHEANFKMDSVRNNSPEMLRQEYRGGRRELEYAGEEDGCCIQYLARRAYPPPPSLRIYIRSQIASCVQSACANEGSRHPFERNQRSRASVFVSFPLCLSARRERATFSLPGVS